MANPSENIPHHFHPMPSGEAVIKTIPFRLGAVRAKSTQETARVQPAKDFSLVRFFSSIGKEMNIKNDEYECFF
jgi:hypothetical protein